MNFTLAFFKISVYSKDNLMSEDFRKLEEKGMSFTGSLKKTLAVLMSAAVLSTAGVMMASADATVNLMPADVSAIICGRRRNCGDTGWVYCLQSWFGGYQLHLCGYFSGRHVNHRLSVF